MPPKYKTRTAKNTASLLLPLKRSKKVSKARKPARSTDLIQAEPLVLNATKHCINSFKLKPLPKIPLQLDT